MKSDYINKIYDSSYKMDVIIVSTPTPQLADYWRQRLATSPCCKGSSIIVVVEDWPSGAGNGLGTLYAYKKACLLAKENTQAPMDIEALLQGGASVALYHTAGKGKRLYPLTASELGGKSGLLLPCPTETTILEMIIRQTSLYAPARKGRLSVFWGDQIFFPTTTITPPSSHIEVFAKKIDRPNKSRWQSEGLHHYGIALFKNDCDDTLIEKVSFESFENLSPAASDVEVGLSLGCFSLSKEILQTLLEGFDDSLKAKKGKLDSDPHFWMPLIYDQRQYLELMERRNEENIDLTHHYERMQHIKAVIDESKYEKLFSFTDIGYDGYIWDYGTLGNYYNNIMKLLDEGSEGETLRHLFGITSQYRQKNNIVINSLWEEGSVTDSVLYNVTTGKIDVKDSVLINTSATEVIGNGILTYRVTEENGLKLMPGEVRSDILMPTKNTETSFYTMLTNNGYDDWNEVLPKNPLSYRELSKLSLGCNKESAY